MQEERDPHPPASDQAETRPQTSDVRPEQQADDVPESKPAPQPDRFDHFTAQARATLNYADKEARRLGHQVIGDEHLLLGLLRAKDGAASGLLQAAGVSIERAREVVGALEEGVAGGDGAMDISLAERGKRAIVSAVDAARARRRTKVTTVHLLLAVVYGVPGGRAQDALKQLGVDPVTVYARAAQAENRVPQGNDERRGNPRAWDVIVTNTN